MIYHKNVPGWERAARVVAGVAMVACGVAAPGLSLTPVGWIVAGAGLVTVATGFVGFCPACAMVGRRLKEER